jgi:hypothetical protein
VNAKVLRHTVARSLLDSQQTDSSNANVSHHTVASWTVSKQTRRIQRCLSANRIFAYRGVCQQTDSSNAKVSVSKQPCRLSATSDLKILLFDSQQTDSLNAKVSLHTVASSTVSNRLVGPQKTLLRLSANRLFEYKGVASSSTFHCHGIPA